MVLPSAAAMAAAVPPSRLLCTVLGWAEAAVAGLGAAAGLMMALGGWPGACSAASALARRLARLLGVTLLPAKGLQYVLAMLPAAGGAAPGAAAPPRAAPAAAGDSR